MALGTYVGGWRIIHTLGEKITHLTPVQGFAAETATAAILLTTSSYGLPVSTTHTISGSILGAGAAADRKSVNWKIVKHILTAWLVTIPITAVVGGLAQLVTRLPYGTGILLLLAVVVVLTIYVTRDWTREEFAQVKNLMAVVRERRKKSS
jgi:PiT family inorganic phosphate transporter